MANIPASPAKYKTGSSQPYSTHAADPGTSQEALKDEFRDNIVFDVDFDKRMGLSTVKDAPSCRMAIEEEVKMCLAQITKATEETQTYGPWVCSVSTHTERYQ